VKEGLRTAVAACASTLPGTLRIPSDEELAASSQQGDREAFSVLVTRYSNRLFNFLKRRAPSDADAEDLTQDTFVRAWTKIGTYKAGMRFSTWLYTIGTNLAATRARTRRLPMAGTLAAEPAAAETGPGDGPDELAVRLWRAADEVLPEEQRSAVWLRYAEDLGVPEIARVLGKSRVNIRVMLFRARRTLAAELAKIDGNGKDGAR
jgi:RNA polymerase sigma-70 factor (ECF subfamily)